ncbi:MAG: patatin-like phospholipase family protein [Pseudomonadota bacterium]
MAIFNAMGINLAPSLKNIPFLADVPGRALRAAGKGATWFSLPAGNPLFKAGEDADCIYFVLTGALGAFRRSMDGRNEFVGHIRAGEPVGEMAMFLAQDSDGDGVLEDEPHTNSVFALRDSEILRLSRKGFDRLIKAEPELLEAMIRLILLRLKQSRRRSDRAEPKVFALIGASPTIDLELRAETLKSSLAKLGLNAVVVSDTEGEDKPTAYFDELERDNDLVILTAPIGDTGWYRLALRQADRIWVLGRADARPSVPLMPEKDYSPARSFQLIDVVLCHPGSGRTGSRPQEWKDAAGASRILHWHGLDNWECDRLARVMAGRSIGLCLSGGGARAYAHIGAVRAIRERGVPLDFVGGSSMGAVIAACVAMGWDDDEIDWRIRKGFVASNPLGDWTLPVVSMVRGHRVDSRLKEHFGNAEIGDLDLPFFAVSTNLTDGAFRVHRSGVLHRALRASIALPGILPPVVQDGDVLVDGAVLNNFPVDVMRDFHRGAVIGCDVARAPQGLDASEFVENKGFFSWVFEHGFSAAPPIAGLLMRAGTLSINPNAGRELADMLILPELEGIELRDWKAYDAAVDAGYTAAVKALDGGELFPGAEKRRRTGETKIAETAVG